MPNESNRASTAKQYFTENGKEIALFKVANTSLYRIGFVDGGELPDSLKNESFTNPVLGAKAIEKYLADKEKEKQVREAKKKEDDEKLREKVTGKDSKSDGKVKKSGEK